MPNRLASETSPYLLQHANNPVDWYPWGPEALRHARDQDRPILLSIGYAACHWCHVMERESFENHATAAVMNEHFVNIKVDREERPDLDSIYMQAVQAMTGHGGWPMTMFLTPAGEPFYGGTYFPPEDRHGIPSFTRILHSVADAYRTKRDSVAQSAESVRAIYASANEPLRAPDGGPPSALVLERAYRGLAGAFDMRHAGFGGAPKFPPTMALDFLLRHWARTGTSWALDMVVQTFRRMARGGLYDQVGGGFARYSVDAEWLVPHFEKMLYDNALLVRLGTHLWQATKDDEVRRVTEETVDWVAREMTSPDGGFYSSLDADSEGHEGKFYVWSEAELDETLGADATAAKMYWGVMAGGGGNFEGTNILHVPHEPAMIARRLGLDDATLAATIDRARAALTARRASRIRPGLDDKILASWNGLMLRGLADAARAFESERMKQLALRNAGFLWQSLVADDRVRRVFKNGASRIPGFLDDHAAIALGFIAVYQLTFDERWLDRARRLGDSIERWFIDAGTGLMFDTASDAEALITRPRDLTDNAMPSGSSLAVELMLELAEFFGESGRRARADAILASLAEPMARHPLAFGHLLGAADGAVHGAVEVAIAGDTRDAHFRTLASVVARQYLPSLVLAGGSASSSGVALLEGRVTPGTPPTAYVCRRYACEAPATDATALAIQLERAAKSAPPS